MLMAGALVCDQRIEIGGLLTNQRYVLLSLIVGAVLIALTVHAACVSTFAQFGIADFRIMGLVNLSVASAVVVAVISFVVVIRQEHILQFMTEVVSETLQVTWPGREETIRMSATVVLVTLFTAGLLAGYDLVFKNLADIILFSGS